jgi:hypothetical protein
MHILLLCGERRSGSFDFLTSSGLGRAREQHPKGV